MIDSENRAAIFFTNGDSNGPRARLVREFEDVRREAREEIAQLAEDHAKELEDGMENDREILNTPDLLAGAVGAVHVLRGLAAEIREGK